MEIGAVGNVAAANVQRPMENTQATPAQTNNATVSQTAVQTVNAVQQAEEAMAMSSVRQAVDDINRSEQVRSNGLRFKVDEETEKTVVSVIDQKTEEVIRQIPSEEALAIAQSLEQAIGNLIKEKA